ncbi:hypothetical protein MK079_01260 [Candidatus Gracilibacteria bacterium]|nr:hypothetical protein [Candidatus Gracilibacteria bacterium]
MIYQQFSEKIQAFHPKDRDLMLHTYSFGKKELTHPNIPYPISIGIALWEKDKTQSLYDEGCKKKCSKMNTSFFAVKPDKRW